MAFLQQIAVDSQNVINVNDSIKAVTESIIEQVKDDPNVFVKDVLDKALDFGLKLVAAIAIYIVGAWLIKKVKNGMIRRFSRRETEKTLATFITSLVSITLTILLVIVTIGTLGINTTSLAALLAAGGMAIGMALSGSVSNFAGGIMLLIFKPFKAGDYITAQGHSGIVTELTIFYTKIRTYDNRLVVIPNGVLSNGNIENAFHDTVRRVNVSVTVEYGTDADKCIELMKTLAAQDKRIIDSSVPGAKDPNVMLASLNDSNIEFTAWLWVKAEDYWSVMYDMNKLYYTELPKNGINFAYPHLDVSVKS